MVISCGLNHVGIQQDLWVISPNMVSPTGYVCWPLLSMERFQLWYYPQYLWGIMNESQLGSLLVDVSRTPPLRISKSALIILVALHQRKESTEEAVCETGAEVSMPSRKCRCGVMLSTAEPKRDKMELSQGLDLPKGRDARLPVEICDQRSLTDQG